MRLFARTPKAKRDDTIAQEISRVSGVETSVYLDASMLSVVVEDVSAQKPPLKPPLPVESAQKKDPNGLVGTRLPSGIKLTEYIAAGGLSVIYKATNTDGKEFVVKLLDPTRVIMSNGKPEIVLTSDYEKFLFSREANYLFGNRFRYVLKGFTSPQDDFQSDGNIKINNKLVPIGTVIHYYVMEYGGTSLKDMLDSKTRIKGFKFNSPEWINEALAYIAPAAVGMAKINQDGVVHCDFKAGNILLTDTEIDEFGFAKTLISDFGLSLRAGEPWIKDLKDGTVRGTPYVHAPDALISPATYAFIQKEFPADFDGKSFDEFVPKNHQGITTIKSDSFAFGSFVYKLLTGKNPITEENSMSTTLKELKKRISSLEGNKSRSDDENKRLADLKAYLPRTEMFSFLRAALIADPPHICTVNSEVPKKVGDAIMRLLNKNADARPTIDEFITQMQRFQEQGVISIRFKHPTEIPPLPEDAAPTAAYKEALEQAAQKQRVLEETANAAKLDAAKMQTQLEQTQLAQQATADQLAKAEEKRKAMELLLNQQIVHAQKQEEEKTRALKRAEELTTLTPGRSWGRLQLGVAALVVAGLGINEVANPKHPVIKPAFNAVSHHTKTFDVTFSYSGKTVQKEEIEIQDANMNVIGKFTLDKDNPKKTYSIEIDPIGNKETNVYFIRTVTYVNGVVGQPRKELYTFKNRKSYWTENDELKPIGSIFGLGGLNYILRSHTSDISYSDIDTSPPKVIRVPSNKKK